MRKGMVKSWGNASSAWSGVQKQRKPDMPYLFPDFVHAGSEERNKAVKQNDRIVGFNLVASHCFQWFSVLYHNLNLKISSKCELFS